MENDIGKPVMASRRINAPAGAIFTLLADPSRHPEFDGSGMLRPGGTKEVVSGVGDVFVMKMYFPEMGDYEMHNLVVVYEIDRSIAWEPTMRHVDPVAEAAARNGSRWRFDLVADGLDATVVTETYDCSDSPEQVRKSVANGTAWIDAMHDTLERLDELCAP